MVAPTPRRMENLRLVPDPAPVNTDPFQLRAFCLYRALLRDRASASAGEQDAEPNLGGKLLYVGELDALSRAMVIAGNVAGCATLAVAADPMVQKLAMRDGAVDFVVTSLDEALRIFKNEIRRRNAVAVSVTAEPDAVEREMLERGVLPDLLFAGQRDEPREVCHFGPGEQEVHADTPDVGVAWINWQVERAPAQWMQRLDAIAIECLAGDRWASRWIRLGPRYLGRAAQAQRALYCDAPAANEVVRRFREAVGGGAIGTEVSMSLRIRDEMKVFQFVPADGA
jgi:urocanate hydratase